MSITNRYTVLIASLGCLLYLEGCSFSHSSESGSDSSQSFSHSSSSFSDGDSRYESDVMDYTYAYLKSTSGVTDYVGYRKGLSDIAEKRGISDWESDEHTYLAMGKALRKARMQGVGYETFKKNLGDGDSKHMKQIQQGYDSRD